MVNIGSNTVRNILDCKLSGYACYLIVLNCDPRKEIINNNTIGILICKKENKFVIECKLA